MTFFDTARAYTDSEEKLGIAFEGMRDKVYIASKTHSDTPEKFWADLETTLKNLKTDYLDLYQLHQVPQCYRPGDGTGMYEALTEAKEKGLVRHIGVTAHKIGVAEEVVASGLYETLQYPFNYISTEREIALVKACGEAGMGFIAMKGLSGGLLTNSQACMAFMSQFDNVLPIWGIQRESELDEFISFQSNPPVLTDDMRARIEKDRQELSGDFCRGCGYCQPCPAGIEIESCNRMYLFLRRAPYSVYLTDEFYEKMQQVKQCLRCGQCRDKCPYNLDTPNLLQRNYDDFMAHWSKKDQLNPENKKK
jgi:predicted aldo/keto reductase-like oxidoreductase